MSSQSHGLNVCTTHVHESYIIQFEDPETCVLLDVALGLSLRLSLQLSLRVVTGGSLRVVTGVVTDTTVLLCGHHLTSVYDGYRACRVRHN